jgi:hypothetical protein
VLTDQQIRQPAILKDTPLCEIDVARLGFDFA